MFLVHFRRELILFLIRVLFFCGCNQQEVLHSISEHDANSLLTKLNESGIIGQKKADSDGRWSVNVDRVDGPAAIKVVSRSRDIVTDSGQEESQGGFFSSKEDRKFQLARVLSRQIEKTLIVLPGVHEAKIHLNLVDRDQVIDSILNAEEFGMQTGSASALLVVESVRDFNKKDIATLISGASGIPRSQISVWITVDKIGVRLLKSKATREGSSLNPSLEVKEEALKTKIQEPTELGLASGFFAVFTEYSKVIGACLGAVLLSIGAIYFFYSHKLRRNLKRTIPKYV
jgi:type III secretory pathway lipoprotein EscJ